MSPEGVLMVAMGGMAGVLRLFATHRGGVLARRGGVSTFGLGGGSLEKGLIVMGVGGRSWLFLCRLGLRLRLSMAVGWTLWRVGGGGVLVMAGGGGGGERGVS